MNEIVISAENIGKRYRLGGRVPYKALRDTLAGFVKTGVRNLRHFSRMPFKNSCPSVKFVDKALDFWALKDVSFEVKRGEVVGIIGRNGAGKSTLLKILSRITEPTEGRIDLHGRVGSLLEVGTGFHPELTGRENIFLNGAILGMKRAEIRRKFAEIVEFAETEKFLDTPVKHYSSGMYMRLAFSVAAHLEPEILLVDEVLAVGDAAFQKKCLGKMSAVAHAGRTVLFVSHNMAAVEKLCGNCCLLQDGKIVKTGRTPEVIHAYMQQTVMAPQNLLSRNDRNGNGVLRFTGFTLRDSRQNLLPSFRTGSTAIFEISFINPGDMPLRNVSISLGIDNLMGERIAVLDNEMTNQIFGVIARSVKSILIEVPNLPLLPGRYGVTLFAKAGSEIADWVQNAGSFDVDSGDFFGTGRLATGQGHIAIAHSFRLQT